MTTYNTKDPLGSASPKNLYDNSQNLDHATNDRTSETWEDRFGIERISWHGMEKKHQRIIEQYEHDMLQAILSAGYAPVGTFQGGAKIAQRNEVVLWMLPDGDGEYYRWDGPIPKTVSENSTPASTGGIKSTENPNGLWVGVGDASLRSALIKGDGSLIGVGNGNTLDTKLKSMLSAVDYGFVGEFTEDKSVQFGNMLRDAIREGIRVIHFPQKATFDLEADILLNRNTILVGNAEIRTSNPNNRYLKCYRECNTPIEVDCATLGDLSSFSSAALKAKYMGDRKPKVVFIGDSLLMGGQHRFDFTGLSERLKSAIRNGVGQDCDFYNRAIAGSAIGEFLGKIPTYANVNEVHGNGEEPWITDKSRTWLSYIDDIQPDLVVIAYGMNASNANDTHNCLKVRSALKGLNSAPSIIWVTTPMRTIDVSKEYNGTKFGTYPNNEYSNSAGMAYGAYGKWVGDSVIDANLASNIVMLGVDPRSCRVLSQDAKRHVVTGNGTSSVSGKYISATLGANDTLKSSEYMRDGALELKIDSLSNVIRLRGRNDPNSINCIYVDISPNEIKVHAPHPNTAEMGLIKSHQIETVGKSIRFQFSNSRVFINVDAITVIDIYDIYASRFTSQISVQAVNGSCSISGVVFYSAEYKTNPPLLTVDEIFSPDYGFGGNLLNHPNTLGNEYIYGTALRTLSGKLREATGKNALVNKSQVSLLAPGVTGNITARRVGNLIFIEASDIDGNLAAYSTLTTLDILFWPQNTVYGTGTVIAVSGGNATFTGVRIGSNGRLVLTTPLPNGSGKVAFSINFAKAI